MDWKYNGVHENYFFILDYIKQKQFKNIKELDNKIEKNM